MRQMGHINWLQLLVLEKRGQWLTFISSSCRQLQSQTPDPCLCLFLVVGVSLSFLMGTRSVSHVYFCLICIFCTMFIFTLLNHFGKTVENCRSFDAFFRIMSIIVDCTHICLSVSCDENIIIIIEYHYYYCY